MSKDRPIRVGDNKTRIEVYFVEYDEVTKQDVPVDISTAIADGSKEIKIKRPDGTTILATGDAVNFITDGVDGGAYYLLRVGDILHDDTHYIQGFIDTAVWTGHSEIGTFEVEGNL